jgi:DNA-binding XRE family transcriptional regulator
MRKNKYNKEQSYQGAMNILKRIESHYNGYFSRSDFNRYMGFKLKEIRLSLNQTQTDLSKAADVTFQQIQKYENGINAVPLYKLILLCKFFNKVTDEHNKHGEKNAGVHHSSKPYIGVETFTNPITQLINGGDNDNKS